MVMDRIEVITSVERKRRWSVAEKARLVAAMNEPGAGMRAAALEDHRARVVLKLPVRPG